MPRWVGALDQGTTSTRFIVFDEAANEVARHQLEHQQILPRPGWVEHDPVEIAERTDTVIRRALQKAGATKGDLAAIGITNQRETTVIWDAANGTPFCNALVWQDTRTDRLVSEIDRRGDGEIIRRKAGLPPATYFSGGKIRWILDNVPDAAAAARSGRARFGTIDSWVIWNLTGGKDGGVHVTDVTNASRTMLMNLETLDWDEELLAVFDIPSSLLPKILPSSTPDFHGHTRRDGPVGVEVPIAGVLGDQQAAMVGQVCFRPGEAKNTYGTGNFMLLNTGSEIVPSKAGLLTTVCYQFAPEPAVYALEGSVAVTGSAVQWLRDQLGLIRNAAEIETLANSVQDNGGVYFVPAFSGLFAPYWRSDARGIIAGLSRYNNRGHLARAVLESICYQTKDVLEAMLTDSGVPLTVLKVDGGATVNDTLMQLQADILGVQVERPQVTETTALGAAYAAGLATGVWQTKDQLRSQWKVDRTWEPAWTGRQRKLGYSAWKKAVERTFGWIEA